MSGNQQYTMKIVLDDSQVKDLENKLKNAFGIGLKSGGGSSGSSPMKNLLKLGGIATGIAGLVSIGKKILDLTIDSSPMLKGMLQLFGNTMMFILRPIGDFIGYMLKPIMFYLLRYIAIPFYKHYAPFLQKWGTKIGTFITEGIKYFAPVLNPPSSSNPAGYVVDLLFPSKAATDLADWLKSNNVLGGLFDPNNDKYIFKPLLSVNLTSLWNIAITPLKSFFNILQTINLTSLWNAASAPIQNLFISLKFTFQSIQKIWEKVITPITDFFTSLKFIFGSTLQHLWATVVDKINGFFQAIADFLKDPIGTIQKALTPKPSPNSVTGSNGFQIGTPSIQINIDKAIGDVSSWGRDFEQIINDAVKKIQNMGTHP